MSSDSMVWLEPENRPSPNHLPKNPLNGKFGASFFCSRDLEDRSDLQKLFPTLISQLACRCPHFRKRLLEILKEHPDTGPELLCSQMEKLLVGPLKAIRAAKPHMRSESVCFL